MKTLKFMSFLSLLLLTINSYSQTYRLMVKTQEQSLWGYADLSGELIIPAHYKKCYAFSDNGLAIFKDYETKKYHIIDVNGKEISTEQNDFVFKSFLGLGVQGYSEGLVAVRFPDKKWGYLDNKGVLKIAARYNSARKFNGGYAIAQIGDRFYILDKKGNESLLDYEGDRITSVKQFSEGMAPYKTVKKQMGFINTKGEFVIPAQYLTVGEFKNGLAFVKLENGNFAYINHQNKMIIHHPNFTSAKNFDLEIGVARVKVGKLWKYINKNGYFIPIPKNEIYEDFHNGLLRARLGGLYGYLNKEGEWVIEPQYTGARDFKNNYAAVKKGELWGIINKEGKWMIEPKYIGIKDVELVK